MPPNRLILATGSEELDRYYQDLAEDGKIEVSARVFYREAVSDAVKRNEADTLLISAYLEGTKDLADVVFEARLSGLRVVFLAGDMPRQSQLIKDLIAMGVYDILFYGEDRALGVEEIDSCLAMPRTFAQVLKECSVTARPQPKKDFFALFRRFTDVLRARDEHTEALQKPPEGESAGASSEPIKLAGAGAERHPKKKAHRVQKVQDVPLLSEPADASMPLEKPVVAVWSPAACGKTFVSIALARALAGRGVKVGLVDLDTYKQSVHTYLNLPKGEDALGEVLSPAIVVTDGPFGIEAQGVTCFSRDPELERLELQPHQLERFLNSPDVDVDLFVCDMPSDLPDWARMVLSSAQVKVLVADPDPAHMAVVRREMPKVPWDHVVLNRAKQGAVSWTGIKPAVVLSENATGDEALKGVEALASAVEKSLGQRQSGVPAGSALAGQGCGGVRGADEAGKPGAQRGPEKRKNAQPTAAAGKARAPAN